MGRETVEGILKDEYREDLNLEEAKKLAVKCLKKALQAREEQLRVKISTVPTATRTYEIVPSEEVEKHLQAVE